MIYKEFFSEGIMPADGSRELIAEWRKAKGLEELQIFPDVHFKKGSKVVNGMLTKSESRIFPSMLGVANCGFSFGKIIGDNIEERFIGFASNLLDYSQEERFSKKSVVDSFNNSLKVLFQNNDYRKTFEFLNIENDNDLREFMHRWLTPEMIRRCRVSLGTLGGGNHFFELQKVNESDSEDFEKGDYITVLHTDSISVGISVLSLFSNLNEFDYLPFGKRWYKKLVGRYNQFRHFSRIKIQGRRDIIDLAVLLFGKDPKRSVSVKSVIGKNIIEGFLFSSVFGEMNRATIIETFQHFSGLDVVNVNSISHDSVFIENDIHGNTCVIQRNGVQRVGRNTNFILPGALGTEAYIFKSNGNQNSYYSANHGVGRILDKKEARDAFSDEDTLKDLKIDNLKIIKIGEGSISEQNNKSFKSVKGVVDEMVRLNLGQTIAMTKPIVSVKS